MNTPSADGHAVIDERAVLDLDPVAERDALIDEDVPTDDARRAPIRAPRRIWARCQTLVPAPIADVGFEVRRRRGSRADGSITGWRLQAVSAR